MMILTNCEADSLLINEVLVDLDDTKRAISNAIDNLNTLMQMMRDLRVCEICSKEYHKGRPSKYCSDSCKERARYLRRKKTRCNGRKDKRLTKNGAADYSITLDKLIDRDGDCCHICGQQTDRNDKRLYTDGKTIICGNNYPSIDHVIPISKGGLHQWDNVKVAHRLCNSKKKDNI